MKVVVLGSQGMAGHMVSAYLRSQGHDVSDVTRRMMDVERPYQVQQWLGTLKADFVVNCIGLLVQPCIQRPDRAAVINAWFPQYLAQQLAESRTRLIHLSTDCVFDGQAGPYAESDPHTELNAYGRSKSLGEVNNTKDITMRMSIIGPELRDGTGLLHWVTANPEAELPGWSNAQWNGITTLQLAKCIHQWIQDPAATGIYHVVNNDVKVSKYQLLQMINRVYELNKTVIETQGPKAVNKVLKDTRLEIDWEIPDYEQQLGELRGFDPSAHVSPATT